jgi:unsaturated rhamnogalacturonyl hydrolase
VLDGRAVSYWDSKTHGWAIAPGTYQILVGSSSRDIRLNGSLTLADPEHPSEQTAGKGNQAVSDWSAAVVESTLKRNPRAAEFGGWGYAKALYLMGQYMVWKRTGDPRYLKYIQDWMDIHVDPNGNIDRKIDALDYVLPGNLLLLLYEQTKEPRYKTAAEQIHERFKTYPRTEDGGLWHANSRQHQLWLDGMYMSMPFLVRYGRMFGDSQAANDEAVKQLLIYASHLRDPKTGLLFHAYDESGQQPWADPRTHHSAELWCRAMGWYGMAVIDVLEALPQDHPRRTELLTLLRGLIEALARYQDPKTGLWYQIVDKGSEQGNWLETSSSSMYTYVVSIAIRRKYVDSQFQRVADRGYEGVMSRVAIGTDGLTDISGICEGTNVSDINYYFQRKQSVNDFHGLGAFLLMNEQRITQRSAMELIP